MERRRSRWNGSEPLPRDYAWYGGKQQQSVWCLWLERGWAEATNDFGLYDMHGNIQSGRPTGQWQFSPTGTDPYQDRWAPTVCWRVVLGLRPERRAGVVPQQRPGAPRQLLRFP